MGDEADNILTSLDLSAADKKKYKTVLAKLDKYFIPRRNVIFERAKFNQRQQMEAETVDNFITDLYNLAEYCEYGALRDEMIRDRLVVGLRDLKVSEKLQLDADVTLEKLLMLHVRVRPLKNSRMLYDQTKYR